MKTFSLMSCVIGLIIGGLIGAFVMHRNLECQTSGVSVRLNSNPQTGAGITVTKTGTGQ